MRALLSRFGFACQVVGLWLGFVAFTDVFAGVHPYLVLAMPVVALVFTFCTPPAVGLVFLVVTLLAQFVGRGPEKIAFGVALGFTAAQAVSWHLRGRVWQLGLVTRQAQMLLDSHLPPGITFQAERVERPDLQGMRYQFFRDEELVAVVVAVALRRVRRPECLGPVLEGFASDVPKMVVPIEFTREPQGVKLLIQELGFYE